VVYQADLRSLQQGLPGALEGIAVVSAATRCDRSPNGALVPQWASTVVMDPSCQHAGTTRRSPRSSHSEIVLNHCRYRSRSRPLTCSRNLMCWRVFFCDQVLDRSWWARRKLPLPAGHSVW